jgi:hypothetical protein
VKPANKTTSMQNDQQGKQQTSTKKQNNKQARSRSKVK